MPRPSPSIAVLPLLLALASAATALAETSMVPGDMEDEAWVEPDLWFALRPELAIVPELFTVYLFRGEVGGGIHTSRGVIHATLDFGWIGFKWLDTPPLEGTEKPDLALDVAAIGGGVVQTRRGGEFMFCGRVSFDLLLDTGPGKDEDPELEAGPPAPMFTLGGSFVFFNDTFDGLPGIRAAIEPGAVFYPAGDTTFVSPTIGFSVGIVVL